MWYNFYNLNPLSIVNKIGKWEDIKTITGNITN